MPVAGRLHPATIVPDHLCGSYFHVEAGSSAWRRTANFAARSAATPRVMKIVIYRDAFLPQPRRRRACRPARAHLPALPTWRAAATIRHHCAMFAYQHFALAINKTSIRKRRWSALSPASCPRQLHCSLPQPERVAGAGYRPAPERHARNGRLFGSLGSSKISA